MAEKDPLVLGKDVILTHFYLFCVVFDTSNQPNDTENTNRHQMADQIMSLFRARHVIVINVIVINLTFQGKVSTMRRPASSLMRGLLLSQ